MILVVNTDFVGQYSLAHNIALDKIIDSYILREEKKTIQRLLGAELAELTIAYIQSTKAILTAGPLTVGQYYEITHYNAGDDFTNVGATSNATGTKFTATGTTPTIWTNLSRLQEQVKRYEDIIQPFFIQPTDGDNFFDDENSFYQSFGLKDLLLIQIYYCYIAENQMKTSGSGVVAADNENSKMQSPQQAMRLGEVKWNNAGMDTWISIQWFCRKYKTTYPEFKGLAESPRYSSIM